MTIPSTIHDQDKVNSIVGISAEIPLLLKKLLCKFSGYYDGELYRFILNSQKELELIPSSDHVPALLIVSRSNYSEQSKEYPIDEKSEVNKLLALEFSNKTRTFYHNWGHNDGKSKVNVWKFHESVPKAMMYLPETLLLALTSSAHQVSIVTTNKHNVDRQLYIGKVEKTILSLYSSSLVNSSKRFAMSVGISQLEPDRYILNKNENRAELAQENSTVTSGTTSFYSFPMLLAYGIKQLTLPIINSFMQLPKAENSMQVFKNITLPMSIVLFVYLSCSSIYLAYEHQKLQQQLSSQGADVSLALDRQQKTDLKNIRFEALARFFANKNDRSRFWLVMADLFPNAVFSDARLVKERFVIRGTTEKATTILELLSNKPQVIDAKFDLPIQRQNNRDSFVISFQLRPSAAAASTAEYKDITNDRA